MDVGYGGNVRLLSAGVGPSPGDFDDPPGLHEKVNHASISTKTSVIIKDYN